MKIELQCTFQENWINAGSPPGKCTARENYLLRMACCKSTAIEHLHDVGKAGLHHGTPVAIALHPQLVPWEVQGPSPTSEHDCAKDWQVCITQQLIRPQHPGAIHKMALVWRLD